MRILFCRSRLACAAFLVLAVPAKAQPPVQTGQLQLQALTDSSDRDRANLGLILGSAAAVALYGNSKWWQDGFGGDFKSRKEGWFGHGTYSGGADKLGHFYINYAGTRLFSRAFEWAGNAPREARVLAGLLMFGTFTGVEILDGFSRQWTFSREDAIINGLGAGFGLLMESRPDLDRMFDFRMHYWPSRGNGFDPFGDYSGQTYLLVTKASGVPALRERPFVRYLELAVGYGTRDYAGHPGEPLSRGRRNVYVGISLNLSALLEDRARKDDDRGMALRATRTALEFVQMPGTAVFTKRSLD